MDGCPNCKRLEAELAELRERLRLLEAYINLNSQTSNQPPSKDPPWKPKSERQKSVRSSGGQKGHAGKTLEFSQTPDFTPELHLTGQCSCGHCWDAVPVADVVKRQVHDLPPVGLQITEYRAEVKICPRCSKKGQAEFPLGVSAHVQYGPNVMGLATYFHIEHHLPLFRTHRILGEVYGAWLAESTILAALNTASEKLVSEQFDKKLSAGLQASSVLCGDETGTKLNGKLSWIHSVSSKLLTHYGFHRQRGFAAIQDMDILPSFTGILMHDCFAPYFQLRLAQHAVCWAHLLRELRGLAEKHHQLWAAQWREEVQLVYHKLKEGTLTLRERNEFMTGFETRLEAVLVEHPERPPPPRVPGERGNGRVKQHPARCFAQRLLRLKEACLRFLMDDACPFDNNQAERDIRRFCIRRKISGGFRTEESARVVCRLMSFTSCLRKQSLAVWPAIRSLFTDAPVMPNFDLS